MEGAPGNNDAEIFSKTFQVENKLFYFDLKENPRGRYLKISEKTSGSRSTIIVPVAGIQCFVELFDYYVNGAEREVTSKEVQLYKKVFYFDVGENKRGRFLKISEASIARNRSTIIVPAGNRAADGWAGFGNVLGEINASQQSSYPSEHLGRLSDHVGSGFLSGGTSITSGDGKEGERAVVLPPAEDTGETMLTKVIRADHKKFFFDLGSNSRGEFLRISEVIGPDRSTIILPISALEDFYDVIGQFIEITRSQGIQDATFANVHTSGHPQRWSESED